MVSRNKIVLIRLLFGDIPISYNHKTSCSNRLFIKCVFQKPVPGKWYKVRQLGLKPAGHTLWPVFSIPETDTYQGICRRFMSSLADKGTYPGLAYEWDDANKHSPYAAINMECISAGDHCSLQPLLRLRL